MELFVAVQDRENNLPICCLMSVYRKKKEISREEALVELVGRYFQSHGPAQIQDFVWWSGLSVKDAKNGIALAGSAIRKEEINGKIYWFKSQTRHIDYI